MDTHFEYVCIFRFQNMFNQWKKRSLAVLWMFSVLWVNYQPASRWWYVRADQNAISSSVERKSRIIINSEDFLKKRIFAISIRGYGCCRQHQQTANKRTSEPTNTHNAISYTKRTNRSFAHTNIQQRTRRATLTHRSEPLTACCHGLASAQLCSHTFSARQIQHTQSMCKLHTESILRHSISNFKYIHKRMGKNWMLMPIERSVDFAKQYHNHSLQHILQSITNGIGISKVISPSQSS